MIKISETEKAKQIAEECKTYWWHEIVDESNGEREWVKYDDFNNCYNSAIKMAEWKEKEFIDKAIGFLEPRILSILSGDKVDTDKFIEEFKKTMTDD